jgi:squalene-hopene/tetraprenyl-beta-curcumene cyclase
MMGRSVLLLCVVAACGNSSGNAAPDPHTHPRVITPVDSDAADVAPVLDWNRAAAATYLERRAAKWLDSRKCALSCHTTHPYLMVESVLTGVGTTGERIRGAITDRVAGWEHAKPWYDSSEAKAQESLATEAVLNAFAISRDDARAGALSTTGRMAFEHLFATQRADGAWDWLDFALQPWESVDFEYGGAALALIAVASAPGDYLGNEAPRENITALRDYLRRRRGEVNLHNRLMLVWAATVVPDLLPAADVDAVIADVVDAQNADGSWTIAALGTWTRKDGTSNPATAPGDGYATGLAVYVLSMRGVEVEAVATGAQWLAKHQLDNGAWPARSLNDDDDFNEGLATDAATAFAVLALTR